MGEGVGDHHPNFPNRCQHIKVNGTLCGSPALRRNRFCYFHKLHHEETIELNTDRARRKRNVTIELPVLEDANSIQVTLMQIMRLIITGQIDGKNAGLLLYALQTASTNLHRTNFAPYLYEMVLDPKTVSQTPIGARIWEASDFSSDNEEDDDEAMRIQAFEEAQRKARKKVAVERWAEAEANRLIAEGAREREAAREAERQRQREVAGLEADRQGEESAQTMPAKDARPAATVTPAGRAVLPPTVHPPRKRPPANVSMDEVQEKGHRSHQESAPRHCRCASKQRKWRSKRVRNQRQRTEPALSEAEGGVRSTQASRLKLLPSLKYNCTLEERTSEQG